MTTKALNPKTAFALLDNQPETIFFYMPVWNGKKENRPPDDFEVVYCNKEAASATGVLQHELLGQRVKSIASVTDALRTHLFKEILQVYETGKHAEDSFFNPVVNKHFHMLRTRVEEGVLSVVRDNTHEIREQEEKNRQTALANSILDTSLNAIFACEAIRESSGQIVDLEMKRINQAFTQMTGLSEEKVIGKTYLSLFPASLQNGTFAMNCQVIETGIGMRKEMYYKGDNLDAWFDVSLAKLGEDGLLVTSSDITEQKKIFLQTEQQKTLLDNILRHSANGISVTEVYRDANGKVIDGRTILANDAAVQYTGIPRDLYLSKRATEIDPNIVHSPYFQLCIKTLDTGEPQLSQYFLEFTQRWLEITISRLDATHLITIFTDITATKETQLRQEHLVEELKRSNINLEEFAHAASHDLKEPVRKVHFFTERLKSKLGNRLDAEELQLLERVQTAADRMRLLIDDLLEYSHVNNQSLLVENVDLNKKLQLVLNDLEIPIQEKQATIHADVLPIVKGYRRQLQQLFQNLISNALKYSKPDVAPVIKIHAQEITGEEAGTHILATDWNRKFHCITVQDNGIGFEQEDAQRIFNMFQRLHGKNEYSGTGVGLAIARKVVTNHGGYIWADSKPAEGATFTFLLPIE